MDAPRSCCCTGYLSNPGGVCCQDLGKTVPASAATWTAPFPISIPSGPIQAVSPVIWFVTFNDPRVDELEARIVELEAVIARQIERTRRPARPHRRNVI